MFRIHVRRTDKLIEEAQPHPLHDYMKHVESWFKVNIASGNLDLYDERRVFVATDDPEVLKVLRKWYSIYYNYSMYRIKCPDFPIP